jgi:membrane associated rhomboid family serine protease
MHPASVGFQCPDDVRAGNAAVRRPSRAAGLRLAGRRWGTVTLALIGLNVAMFLLTAVDAAVTGSSPLDDQDSPIFQSLAQVPLFVDIGDWWRPVTAAFLHYGIVHLALNMLSLLLFGAEVERLLGRVRFLAVYAAGLLGGAAAIQLFGSPLGQVAGASTAIYGLFGAVAVVYVHQRLDLRGMLGLLVVNFVYSFVVPGVSVLGHVGGLIGGAVAAAVLVAARRSVPAATAGTAAVVAALLVLVYAVG